MSNLRVFVPIIGVLLFALLFVASVYFKLYQKIGFGDGKAVLVVNSPYGQLTVLLNDSLVGKTPYEGKDLKSGEYSLTAKNDLGIYEGKIKLMSYAQTYVTREVGPSAEFSSGNVVWMESVSSKRTAVSVVSTPVGALVKLDDVEKGKTPLVLDSIPEGTHNLEISREGYDSQVISLKVKRGFKINVNADLFLKPLPTNLEGIDYNSEIKIYSVNLPVTVGYSSWAKGVAYFEKTRGKVVSYDYILDEEGSVYDKGGVKVTVDVPSEVVGTGATKIILYLSKGGGSISSLAEETLAKFFSAKVNLVEVLPTGVGFLRVRAEPSVDSAEMTRINVGERFSVVEERTGWVKIKLVDGREGWSSSAYLKKI